MAESQVKFSLLKIYVKDLSFETSNSPHMFLEKWDEWNPEVDLQLSNKVKVLKDNIHEIVLELTVTAKMNDKMIFLVEVQLAGIFDIMISDKDKRDMWMGGACLQVLFPYAREVVSDVVTRGGFPQLLLSPVNFASLYRQHLEESKAEQSNSGE